MARADVNLILPPDTRANQPAAATVAKGALYFVTDESVLERSNGTAWVAFSGTVIPNDAVTYAKMQNVSAASKLLGRGSAAGAGDPQEIGLGTGLAMTGTTLSATGAAGTVDTSGTPAAGNLAKFTDADTITNADLTGDVTTAGGVATTIANDAVAYAKMQNVSAASKLLGRGSASGAGDPEEITVGSGLAMTGTTLSASGGGGGGGGLVLLETRSAAAGADISFSTRNATGQSGATFQSDFDEYWIVGSGIFPSVNGVDVLMQIGTGATPTYDTTTGHYQWASQGLATDSALTNDSGSTGTGAKVFRLMSNTASFCGQFALTAHSLLSTTLLKTMIGTSFFFNNSPKAVQSTLGLQWTTAGTAATAIRFIPSSGNITGTIKIYGIPK